jgi:hypothetical protein
VTASLIVGFALLIAMRLPAVWEHGRFQDEEATVFLAYAWNFPSTEALFRPFAGYWNLAANAATLLVARAVQGGLLPLEQAPYATMAAGLLAQLLPAFLILTGEARWLGGWMHRGAMLLAIALAPATEEVLLNVMHIQYHLALCVALILALEVPRSLGRRSFALLILFLAPLCGPGAIVFLPLFIFRALAVRDGARATQLAALALGSAIQLGLFYEASPVRGASLPPVDLLAAMAVRLFALPLSGTSGSYALADLARAKPLIMAAVALLLVAGLTALAWSAWKRRDQSLWLLGASVAILGVTLGAGLATSDPYSAFFPYAGPRYNYLPLALFGVLLLAGCRQTGGREPGAVAVGLPALFLVMGAIHYFDPGPLYAEGPNWRNEVQAWRQDPTRPLAVWPAPFAADLSGRALPCKPSGPRGDPTAPRYCESGWISYFHQSQPQSAAAPS